MRTVFTQWWKKGATGVIDGVVRQRVGCWSMVPAHSTSKGDGAPVLPFQAGGAPPRPAGDGPAARANLAAPVLPRRPVLKKRELVYAGVPSWF
jgi:hypothetical protein